MGIQKNQQAKALVQVMVDALLALQRGDEGDASNILLSAVQGIKGADLSRLGAAVGREHQKVHLKHGGIEADIDEALAPLILALWEAGIETNSCCQQAGGGYAYIGFSTETDAARFVGTVVDY